MIGNARPASDPPDALAELTGMNWGMTTIMAAALGVKIWGDRNRLIGNTISAKRAMKFVHCWGSPNRLPHLIDRNTMIYGMGTDPAEGEDSGITIFNTDCRVELRNSILWPAKASGAGPGLVLGPFVEQEVRVSYSVVRGGFTGGAAVLDADPLLVGWQDGDARLLPGSPCIDAGDPSAERDPEGSRADIGAWPFDHENPIFIRGDVNGNGRLELADAVGALMYLFGDAEVSCAKGADLDDGVLLVEDVVLLLSYLFAEGPPPRPPFPVPGTDPTVDRIRCGREN